MISSVILHIDFIDDQMKLPLQAGFVSVLLNK